MRTGQKLLVEIKIFGLLVHITVFLSDLQFELLCPSNVRDQSVTGAGDKIPRLHHDAITLTKGTTQSASDFQ